MSRSRGEVRTWMLALTPVVVVAALFAALFIWLAPAGQERPTGQQIQPTSTPTPTPSPTEAPVAEAVDLVPVLPIEQLPIDIPIGSGLLPGVAVTDSTYLGANGDFFAYGYSTSDGLVCFSLWSMSQSGGRGECVPAEEFAASGVAQDRGAWEFHWYPDGSVTWEGL